jgi:O-antigen/teichoic acid export membrane protein
MQKLPLRPLRLIRLNSTQLTYDLRKIHSDGSAAQEDEETAVARRSRSAVNLPILSTDTLKQVAAAGESGAQHLLRRTPNNYLFNQVYGLWFYVSSFLLTVLITHSVSTGQYGTYAVILTAYNTIVYITAFGLEDATVTFIPRILAEHGVEAAAKLLRYLLAIRLVALVIGISLILFGLPALVLWMAPLPIPGIAQFAHSLRDPVLLSHSTVLAAYAFGSGVANLFSALCAAQMRMKIVLVINGLMQLSFLCIGFVLLHLGWGIDGVLWLQAIGTFVSAVAFAGWQIPFIFTKPTRYQPSLRSVLRLGFSAWLTNLASGALLKQVSVTLLGMFAVSLVQTGYFNLAFQLADSANVLLVSGFLGVGGSALAAAFVGNNYERLARTWQVLIKVETILAAPGLVFCFFNASNIAHVLYGSKFDPVGPLLAIFLFFNLLGRLMGSTIHQVSLYVVGKPGRVVLSQWIGLVVVTLTGIGLIPILGAAGALIADGIGRTVTGILLLFFLLRHLPSHYPKELLWFTLRFLLALVLAALPGLLWHPGDRLLLGASGGIFVILCLGLLLWVKPLNSRDIVMLTEVNPRVAKYIHWFARKADATKA